MDFAGMDCGGMDCGGMDCGGMDFAGTDFSGMDCGAGLWGVLEVVKACHSLADGRSAS